jgi:hypothetical protein
MAQKYAATMYPELIADIDKVHWLIRDCVNNSKVHYCRVVGDEGKPEAALFTRVENNLWALKKHCVLLLWYSERPGAGIALLRDLRRWVDENKAQIVAAGFAADWVSLHEGPFKIAERVGFKQRGRGGYIYFPRGRHA